MQAPCTGLCRLKRFVRRLARWLIYFWDRNRFPRLGKADIVNHLGLANGYSSYLEIATRTTGGKFAEVSDEIFKTRRRVLYNVPADFSDGLAVHCRSAALNSSACLLPLVEAGERFDIVFVDPYHSYEASMVDLELGYRLLGPGGVLVVHDCNPPSLALTTPNYRPNEWVGKTYLAFLDFVGTQPGIEYCVVDTDWGIGLVFRAGEEKPLLKAPLPDRPLLNGRDGRDWQSFKRQRARLLRLVPVPQFLRYFT